MPFILSVFFFVGLFSRRSIFITRVCFVCWQIFLQLRWVMRIFYLGFSCNFIVLLVAQLICHNFRHVLMFVRLHFSNYLDNEIKCGARRANGIHRVYSQTENLSKMQTSKKKPVRLNNGSNSKAGSFP